MNIFNQMDTILQRIEQIAKHEGITITALERIIGASKGVLSRAINNGTDIQSKWLQLVVEKYPLYSESWLLTGKGSILKDNISQSAVTINKKEKDIDNIDYMAKYLETLEKLTNTQEMLVQAQNEKIELLKEIDYLKGQGGDIVAGA